MSRLVLPFAVALAAVLAGCGGSDAPSRPAAATTAASAATRTQAQDAPPARVKPYRDALRRLERRFDARLGLYAIDTGSGGEVAYRAGERFAYASTFKALLAGEVLRRLTPQEMRRTLPITAEQVAAAYSPIAQRHVGGRMTLAALASAAVRYSDNAAANLLLDEVGGPRGLDAALARVGDDVTQMESGEPELNAWVPGQRRDTTTPRAFAQDLRAYVLGDVLDRADRAQLAGWLRRNTTGDGLIRAGVPDGWVVGDKTGTGGVYGTRNDIAVLWPPEGAPVVVAIFTNRPMPEAEYDDALLAEATAIALRSLARS